MSRSVHGLPDRKDVLRRVFVAVVLCRARLARPAAHAQGHPACHVPAGATPFGGWEEAIHLVTGAVLPIWDRITGHPRIYRVQTDEGERMIGRVIAADHLSATLKALGADGRRVEVTPEELADRLLRGARAELSSGWILRRRRVAGQWRMEALGIRFKAEAENPLTGEYSPELEYT